MELGIFNGKYFYCGRPGYRKSKCYISPDIKCSKCGKVGHQKAARRNEGPRVNSQAARKNSYDYKGKAALRTMAGNNEANQVAGLLQGMRPSSIRSVSWVVK